MKITNPKIDEYLRNLSKFGDPVVREMERRAVRSGFPIVGTQVGRLLHILAKSAKARRVFECGSGFGYSTFWFASAIGTGGKVHHTDTSKKNSAAARKYLRRAGLAGRVVFHIGDAVDILGATREKFDIILNDMDKKQYPLAFDLFRSRLKKGGLLISDNLLWHGRVVGKRPGKTTMAILEFNRLIFNSGDFFTVLLPVRDGVGVSMKL